MGLDECIAEVEKGREFYLFHPSSMTAQGIDFTMSLLIYLNELKAIKQREVEE